MMNGKPIFAAWLLVAALVLGACTGGVSGSSNSDATPGSVYFSVGGTVSGLSSTGLVLQNNNGDNLPVYGAGTFAFYTPLTAGNSYVVSVLTQPENPNQTCAVTNATGTITTANVSNVTVVCTDKTTSTDAIGGTVVGLLGTGLTLQNNGADTLAVASNGAFTFATTLASGMPYNVTVLSPPVGPYQNCTITNGSGTTAISDVNDVLLACKTNPNPAHAVGGTVTGVTGSAPITLEDNGRDDITLTTDGPFTFATPIPSGSAYTVTLAATGTQSRTCAFTNAGGVIAGADVTNVTVACASSAAIKVMATVTGLSGTGLVLQDNGFDNLAVTGNGLTAFATTLAAGDTYSVVVLSQPANPGQVCTVANGAGTAQQGVAIDVAVNCPAAAGASFTIGGAVSGLAAGAQVVLEDNGGNALAVGANGAFTFTAPVPASGSYSVTVATQPVGETCAVANGTGTGVMANVTNVAVTCTPITFSIGGTVTGLAAGLQLSLNDNGADVVAVTANGGFVFPTRIAYGGAYAVTIAALPAGQTCTVTNGAGTGVVANVTTVTVSCVGETYTIGGTLAGLAAGAQVTVENNGGDLLAVAANGAFTFNTPVPFNGAYAVTIGTQPVGEICTITNGTGAGVVANVTSVRISCSTTTYTIGGVVSGLGAGSQVVLENNGGNALTVTANGNFTFTTPVAFNGGYAVTVATQPAGQTCTVTNGTGTGVVGNVNTVRVGCSAITYTVGGTLAGLSAGAQVTLDNNGGNALTLAANGNFTFTAPIAFDGGYAVTVGTQPTGATCTVTNGTGTGVMANVANVSVTCATTTYTISGMVAGLAPGTQVTLDDNGADALTVSAGPNGGNVAFTFPTPIAYDGGYTVTVGTQPTGQTCTVMNGTGTGIMANVTGVTVTCSATTFTIGGTISALAAQEQVVLLNNSADPLAVTANGNFVFDTPVAYGGSYAVTVGTQPTGQVCTSINGAGTDVMADVTTVTIRCVAATYTIGGTISGLGGGSVTLEDNGGDAITLFDDPATGAPPGPFTFATKIAYGQPYVVTVSAQPTGQNCTVTNGQGDATGNVTNVTVSCVPLQYTISGFFYGPTDSTATLTDGTDMVVVATNAGATATFTFPALNYGTAYTVAFVAAPAGESCNITNPSGTLTANVTNVGVNCIIIIR